MPMGQGRQASQVPEDQLVHEDGPDLVRVVASVKAKERPARVTEDERSALHAERMTKIVGKAARSETPHERQVSVMMALASDLAQRDGWTVEEFIDLAKHAFPELGSPT